MVITGAVTKIESRVRITCRSSWYIDRSLRCSGVIITILGVCSHVSAEIKFFNCDRCFTTSGLLNVQFNMSEDGTTFVVTTEYLTEITAGNGQFHITLNVGIVGTCVDIRYPGAGLTPHSHNQVTVHIGILTGTYNLSHIQGTVVRVGL